MTARKSADALVHVSRRWVMRAGLVASTSWLAGGPVAFASRSASPHLLSILNLHTGESGSVQYRAGDDYLPGGLLQLERLLRDHRSGQSFPIDPRLFDILYRLAELAGAEPRFEVISGYRSPASNALLGANSSGVARNSLHMQGKAIDVRLRNVPLARLRDLALGLQQGGVGYYRKSGFVHLDTGRVRAWSG